MTTTRRWRRHWYRLVLPAAALALLVGVTLAARVSEEPDLDDPASLAPSGTGPDGSSELAAMLAGRGVAIDPVDTLADAEEALDAGGDAVLFVPKPTLLGAWLVFLASRQRADHRIVLVAPEAYQLSITGLPVATGQRRWASLATDPGPQCPAAEAVTAGTATVLQHRYAPVEQGEAACYQGGLVRTRVDGTEVFVVGASDPFRNRRINEHGNARLAVELLAARDRVVWAGALPSDADSQLPQLRRPPVDRSPAGGLAALFDGYPPRVLAGLALLALLAVLLALAQARRLGPPAAEPLPVLVPATEAVAGRGRLYQRARSRAAAMAALRAAALPRLVAALGLPPAPPPEPVTVVQAAARRTGLPAEQVHRTLYGAEPETDEQLARAVAALDALERAVTRDDSTGGVVP